MRARPLAAAAAIVLGGSGLYACADIFGFKTLTGPDGAPEGDAAGDGPGVDAGPDACLLSAPPGNPSLPMNPKQTLYTFALRDIYFTTAPDAGLGVYGYNLDGVQTVSPATGSCTASNTVLDDLCGIDDESISLLNKINAQAAMTSLGAVFQDTAINAYVHSGGMSLLLQLTGYNDTANESVQSGATTALFSAPESAGAVAFDGGDSWLIPQDEAKNSSPPNFFPNPGYSFTSTYVNDDTLVAMSPGTFILFHLTLPSSEAVNGTLDVKLYDPILTATLTPRSGGGYDLKNGILAGRWAARDLLTTIFSLTVVPSGPEPACQALGFPTIINNFVCGSVDIRSDGRDDGGLPCDSISVAIGFDAVQASIAGVTDASTYPLPLHPCPEAGPLATCGDL